MQAVRAELRDVAKLTSFFRQAWGEAGGQGALGFTGATEDTINEIASEEFLRKRLRNPDVRIWIVEEAGRVLGFAATRRVDHERIELSGIVVLESTTSRGIGTLLAEKALADAREARFRKVVVKTETKNDRAIGFYRKLGFAIMGEGREPVEGGNVPVTILEKELASFEDETPS